MDNLIDISSYTTFDLPSKVKSITHFTGEENLEEFFAKNDNVFVLGGGSNIILSLDLSDKAVLKIENKDIEIVEQNNNDITLRIAAGEIWDNVVSFACENGYSGIEAMSAIPGIAGATPVQNVGAYGEEIKDVLVSLEAYDRLEKKYVTILAEECDFSYRMSRFKKDWKDRFIITYITIQLSKEKPKIPDYKKVTDYFKNKNIDSPTLMDVREAIIEIRWQGLPKPNEIPNCGSFFENPIVEKSLADKLKIEYPEMPSFIVSPKTVLGAELPTSPTGERVKIPAGWLIDHAGLKGADFGTVGTYEKNALVLINRGSATQADVIHARDEIIKTVFQKFGITLESEPEIVK